MAIPTFIIAENILYANVGDANNLPMTTLSFSIITDFSGKQFVVFPDAQAAELYLEEWFEMEPTSSSAIEIDGNDCVELSYFELQIHANNNNNQADWDLWFDACKPVSNHIGHNAPFDGLMFSATGEEWQHVINTYTETPDCVWTIVDGGDDEDTEEPSITIESGLTRINVIGYIITALPYRKMLTVLDN